MRVLVAGGSGAIGRPLLPMLVGAGHDVFATTRSPQKAAEITATGAKPETVDLLEEGAAAELIDLVKPDVVIDELTSLPQNFDPRKAKAAYAANDRIREVGSGALIRAAENGDVQRYVIQSIAFIYRPGGDQPKTEDDPVWSDAPAPFDHAVAVLDANERKVTGSDRFAGVVLRYGFLYGPGTWYETGGSTYRAVEARQYPIVSGGNGKTSFVHVADAATATVLAAEKGAGIFNIVDDEPAAGSEFIPYYAEQIGAGPPRRVPAWLVRLTAGKYIAAAATSLPATSNARAKAELGWAPLIPSWREGLRDFRDSDPA